MRRELADAVRPAGVSPETPFRVWKLPDSDAGIVGTQYPVSKMIGAASIVRESSKTLSEAYVETGEAFGVEFRDGDNWLLDDPESQSSTPPPIFGDNTGFFSKFLPQPTAERVKTVINGFGSNFAGPSTSFRSSNPLAFGPVAKRPTYSIEPGTIGLGNLYVQLNVN
jgi:ubiquitin carboxyl-terminal hydrolase 4/11